MKPPSRTETVVGSPGAALHAAVPAASVTAPQRRVPSVATKVTVWPATGAPLLVSVALRPDTPNVSGDSVAVPAVRVVCGIAAVRSPFTQMPRSSAGLGPMLMGPSSLAPVAMLKR